MLCSLYLHCFGIVINCATFGQKFSFERVFLARGGGGKGVFEISISMIIHLKPVKYLLDTCFNKLIQHDILFYSSEQGVYYPCQIEL